MQRANGIPADLNALVGAAIHIADIESAAIFVLPAGATELELATAAGIEGQPLTRLTEAVRNPTHPIAQTAADGTASFDIAPIAPGGPALRSHIPLILENEGSPVVLGVLAVAHQTRLDETSRHELDELADHAAVILSRARQP